MPRLYPLRGLPAQGQLWSWISFDVANQSFTLLINTLLFPIFFTKVVAAGSKVPGSVWSLTTAASMALVVLASPLAGAIADDRRWKKQALVVTGLGCALLTCLLGLIAPGMLWLAIFLYIPANFLFSIGENFLAAFLPELARREDFGRVSGFSWAVAYASALFMLVVTAVAMISLDLRAPDQWRPFFVAAGLWFALFTVPTILFLRERPNPSPPSGHSVLAVGFIRLAQSLRRTRQFPDLAMLLAASLLYGTGMNVIIFFAAILAEEFGFRDQELVIFVAVITVSGVVGTLVPTLFQDRIGHRRTTLLLLGLWIATALAFALYAFLRSQSPAPAAFPTWPMWAIGNLVGFGLGSLGSANRAFVGFLTPPDRTAEVFGLWGMIFKASTILTLPFAAMRDAAGTTWALLIFAAFLAAGAGATLLVNERRGAAAARPGPDPTLRP
jgi:MFS transporter, UMF1 family